MNIHPFISILIPVRNEEKHISDCLKHVLNSLYPKDRMEVLVIDGGSRDRTKEIVKGFMSSNIPIYLLDNPKRQQASALNIGIKTAKGDIILRVDARCMIPPDYIPKCIETLIETEADNVGGIARPISKNVIQEAIGLALSCPLAIGNKRFNSKSGYTNSVYLGCFRREVFDKIGLFIDEDAPIIAEDSDMNERIIRAGGKIYLNADILYYYYVRDNFKDFWRSFFQYGSSRACDLLLNPTKVSWRHLVSPTLVITFLVLVVFSIIRIWFFEVLAVLVSVGAITDLVVSSILSIRNKKLSLLPRLIVAFPCMYFAHGLGFLKRLILEPQKCTSYLKR